MDAQLCLPGHTFPTAFAPVIVAAGLAQHDRVFALGPVLLAFAAGWLIQFAGVVTDNYSNLRREPDDREHPELVRAMASGLLSLADLRHDDFSVRAWRWCSGSRSRQSPAGR